jgi:hypothetical protein
MSDKVLLGYEIPSGAPVHIPLRHTVITGQSQEAGKTTALEALIARSQRKAIAFITKRGERSFTDGKRVPPYFRERADWKFVASILEASQGEKLKFERSWIMRASKGADTLSDVQRNVRKAMADPKTRGLSADVYLTLSEYLDEIVPEIERIDWAKRVVLSPGINVMDLSPLKAEMQHLVIRSTIEWVQDNEEETIVIVPEAWFFIPQGRGAPVKLAAEKFIRQGAALGNYLWLDSQDIAGVDKAILKQVPVWVLGVQRESNEVKRTLDQIPAGIKKPKPDAIATLGLGEFFACHGSTITKAYVQPTWLDDTAAKLIATGKGVKPTPARRAASPPVPPIEDTVTEKEARELRETNERLTADNAELRARLDRLESERAGAVKIVKTTADAPPVPTRSFTAEESFDNEAMYQAFKKRLVEEAPAVLRLVTLKPEIIVEIERKTITISSGSLRARVARVIAAGFIRETRKTGEIKREMERTGGEVNSGNLGTELKKLVVDGFLTAEDEGYREVAGMKVNIVER